jgi:serine/threonine-protein kinase
MAPDTSAPTAPPVPDTLADLLARATGAEFDILGLLGRGGMASVYLAHERGLDRRVAIKVATPELLTINPSTAERFVQEARVAASLSHPHIIPIYTVRNVDGLFFFVMQFIDGWPLDVVLRERGALAPAVLAALLSQSADALAHAHRRGVVHRDLKPGNIMVDRDGRAVVLDFGIAKVAQGLAMTQTGTALGTPTYMSPEQCRGQIATAASDQYALGMVAFELLAGRPAFRSETTFGLIYSHVQELPPSLRELCPDCPAPLADAIMRMIAKEPSERWPSLDALVEALRRMGSDNQAAVRETLFPGVPSVLAAVTTPGAPAPVQVTAPVPLMRTAPVTPLAPVAPSRSAEAMPAPPTLNPPGPPTLDVHIVRGTLTVGQTFPLATLVSRPDHQAGPLDWRSADPSVVRVSPDGRATAEQTGTVEIYVSDGAVERHARLDVTRTSVVRLRVDAPSGLLTVGDELKLEAVPMDQLGAPLQRRLVEWRSSSPCIATVSARGVVKGRAPGTVTITALCGGRQDLVTLTVDQPRITGVLVQPRSLRLIPGEHAALTAFALTSRGRTLPGLPVTWGTTDRSIAEVESDGTVIAHREGMVRIHAMIAECRGVVPVEVRTIEDE